MTSAQRLDWIGEFAQVLLLLAAIAVVDRMINGPSHHPTTAIPLIWRWVIFFVFAAAFTEARTRIKAWRARRRAARSS